MDRNTIIGFVLLAVLFIGYFYYTKQGQVALDNERTHIQDSLSRVKPKADTMAAKADYAKKDSVLKTTSPTFQQDSITNVEQLTTLENEVLKITFTNKGGQPKIVELKKFKTFNGKPLILQNGSFNKISYAINTSVNQTAQTADLYFKIQQDSSVNKQHNINFIVQNADGQIIEHQYNLSDSGYMLDFNIKLNGSDKLITQNKINLTWLAQAPQVEKNIEHERIQSHITYVTDGDYDYEDLGIGSDEKFSKPVDWISLKQQFFATAILAKNKFESADVQWTVPKDTNLHIIAQTTSNCRINVPGGSVANIPLQLFYGPSDYKILKSYDNQMFNIVPLGSGVFAFVKYINRGFIMPVFNFLGSKFASYGLVIALLTIIIRLLISPLTYQSYLSGAKMKLLKPEIDALKVKYGDDKQAFGMEQMKLFKSAGVNPLGGCIPALLQIPIFFALYSFFNSNIALRGQSFWWAKDLSSYDSIYDLPFTIPLYGSHISLFTIFAVVTSLLISIYGMANMQDTGNPVMKYMPYIFPVILLGVFNSQPAALTWYYTVSNAITLLIQFVIQKYIINHEKILAKLEENKKKPKVKSKWQERVEAMQANNQKLQSMKQKVNKTKK
ncbi:MAG TPA: membrane protein insertase YidC [Chitinophagaceae bacterium]|nr:membrane protein insertase YidC [Chitinophagaceae bacterium]